MEKLQSTYSDIKAELTKPDVPLSTRANNVLQYSRDQASPLVHEALEAIRGIIGKAEKKGSEAADQVQTTVNGTT